VTICIAARADNNCFVTVSDQRLSYGDTIATSDRAASKVMSIATHWHVLYSGDVGLAVQIIDDARRRLYSAKDGITPEIARAAVLGAYRHFQRERAFGMKNPMGYESLQEMREKAPKDMGQELFEKLYADLENFDIGVDLIVCGFEDLPFKVEDWQKFWHIFSVTSPGVAHDHSTDGFWAIGSGWEPALASLTANRGHWSPSLDSLVYMLCEAKFCAESAFGVGRATTVRVFGPNGKSVTLNDASVNRLRAIWEEKMKNVVPDDVYFALKDQFSSVDPFSDL
jgi:20S proteasome alpha/beta subunit